MKSRCGLPFSRQSRDGFAAPRACDEDAEPLIPGFLALCAHDPEYAHPFVPGGSGLKMRPGLLLCAKLLPQRRRKLRRALFKRVNAGPFFIPCVKCGEPRLCHPPFFDKPLNVLHVHVAPDTPGPSRGETGRKAVCVEAAPYAVNPTETECFVERLGVRDPLACRVGSVKPHDKLGTAGMVLLQPGAE